MYKHDPTDQATKERSAQGKRGLIARLMAYEIFKLPHICETCGYSGRVEVHHINKDRDDNSRENIKILCRKCHNKLHGVILPKRELTPEAELFKELPVLPSAFKYNSKTYINKKKRRRETEKYREKWGIIGNN